MRPAVPEWPLGHIWAGLNPKGRALEARRARMALRAYLGLFGPEGPFSALHVCARTSVGIRILSLDWTLPPLMREL